MKNIVFHADGFGDAFVCFKALYAIKELYPEYKLSFLTRGGGIEPAFLEKIAFIDKIIIYQNDFFEKIQSANPQIFISTQRQGKYFKELKRLNLPKCIVHAHFISLSSKKLSTPFPFFRAKKHMSEIVLRLVRAIDTKHFDKNLKKIDFSRVKNLLPYDTKLSDEFFSKIDAKYEKIVGINAFSNCSEGGGYNFFIKDWINLGRILALQYPNFLFLLLNFEKNPIQYKIEENTNLKVFVNNTSIASLLSISKKLDFLISVDTGNVHICDILQIPSLVLISKIVAYRFSGGSYGSSCDKLVLKPTWQKEYKKIWEIFLHKARRNLNLLLDKNKG